MKTAREELEKQLRATYPVAQLDFLIRKVLHENREDITLAKNYASMVTDIMNYLIQTHAKVLTFFLFLQKNTVNPLLRASIDDFLKEMFGIEPPNIDPYLELIVGGEPFVDRKDFRAKLKAFFNSPYDRVLVTHGPRYSGRTYKAIFIQHVARHHGLSVVYVDLSKAATVDDLIIQLTIEMQLPEYKLRDVLAQDSTKMKGFISSLKAFTRDDNTRKWCIIFDHHDRPGIDAPTRELTELLASEAKSNWLQNVYIIILGHTNWGYIQPFLAAQFISIPTIPLVEDDFTNFIQDLAESYGEPLSPQEFLKRKSQVCGACSMPYNLDVLQEITLKLRDFIKN